MTEQKTTLKKPSMKLRRRCVRTRIIKWTTRQPRTPRPLDKHNRRYTATLSRIPWDSRILRRSRVTLHMRHNAKFDKTAIAINKYTAIDNGSYTLFVIQEKHGDIPNAITQPTTSR